MRHTLAFLLLAATTAFPAVAQNWTPRDGASNAAAARQHRGDTRNATRTREARPDRPDRNVARNRPAPAASPARATPPARDARRDVRPSGQAFPGRNPSRDVRPAQYQGRNDARRDGRPPQYQDRNDGRRDARPAPSYQGRRDLRPGESFPGRDPRRDLRPNDYNRGQSYRGNTNTRGRWDNAWRNDRRYDWRDYRNSNRGRFRLPRYQAPRGYAYGYRRWSPGYRLQPFFYARSYWIMDPWAYRLPPAYGPYQWVRYYDDVLLVDIETGMVVDVIHDFFWN